MKYVYRVLLALTFLVSVSCSIPPPQPDAQTILENSRSRHDPDGRWSKLKFQLRIQEPRVGNPARFSEVYLDNVAGTFLLKRNRESSVVTYQLSENGAVNILLDGSPSFPDSLVQKYRLQPEGIPNYQRFYQIIYGLPMTLTDEFVAEWGAATEIYYNEAACYKIPIVLRQELFSKNWNIYIAQNDFTYKGMEIVFPDEPEKGERLYFDGEIAISGVQIPRFRHWHDLKDDAYLGSDIIIDRL